VLRAVLCWIGIELKFVSIPKNLLNEIDTESWVGLVRLFVVQLVGFEPSAFDKMTYT